MWAAPGVLSPVGAVAGGEAIVGVGASDGVGPPLEGVGASTEGAGPSLVGGVEGATVGVTAGGGVATGDGDEAGGGEATGGGEETGGVAGATAGGGVAGGGETGAGAGGGGDTGVGGGGGEALGGVTVGAAAGAWAMQQATRAIQTVRARAPRAPAMSRVPSTSGGRRLGYLQGRGGRESSTGVAGEERKEGINRAGVEGR